MAQILKFVSRTERVPRLYTVYRIDYLRNGVKAAPLPLGIIMGLWFGLAAFCWGCWRGIVASRYDAYKQGVRDGKAER